MKTKLSALSILLLGSLGTCRGTGADRRDHQDRWRVRPKASSTREGADNTGINKRDNESTEPTADQQKNSQSDVDLTAKVRRSIVSDKSLSTNAHNVKIIAQNGVVTLKGPVHSEAEKSTIEQRASSIAGQSNVKNEIDVKP